MDDGGARSGSYVRLTDRGRSESGLTRVLAVESLAGGHHLGWVRWHAPWRRYVFHPGEGTLYDEACLREIAKLVGDETRGHTARRAK